MRLEDLRKQQGWTQKQVAQEVGLQLEVYRRYEKEIYVKKLYGCDVITGYCVSVSEIWKTFEKSVKGNG